MKKSKFISDLLSLIACCFSLLTIFPLVLNVFHCKQQLHADSSLVGFEGKPSENDYGLFTDIFNDSDYKNLYTVLTVFVIVCLVFACFVILLSILKICKYKINKFLLAVSLMLFVFTIVSIVLTIILLASTSGTAVLTGNYGNVTYDIEYSLNLGMYLGFIGGVGASLFGVEVSKIK